MKRPVLMMLSIIGVVAVLLAGCVGAYLYIKHPTPHQPAALSPAEQIALQVPLPEMTTNLKGDGLIQFSVTLQASDKNTKSELTTMQPIIQDDLNRLMRKFSSDSLKQVNGYDELKSAIRQTVNRILPSGQVTVVDIPTIIVQ